MSIPVQLARLVLQEFSVRDIFRTYNNPSVTHTKRVGPERELSIVVISRISSDGNGVEKAIMVTFSCGCQLGETCSCARPVHHSCLLTLAELGLHAE